MPITIKEIISSDSMSGVIEKVNFNFDQLILAGGGPPGIQGLQGIDGPIGPQGFRGDHWFAGPSAFGQTADHDGLSSLRVQDHYVDIYGDVYEYYNITGVTGWTASGVNLRGPQGPSGEAGGSLEWKYYLAATAGNPASGNSYGPLPIVGTTALFVDFLIPNLTYKNSVFIGDPNWAYFNLQNFGANNFAQSDTDAIPKFTVIQNNVNSKGLNGFSFGGPLLTGATTVEAYGSAGASSFLGPTTTYDAYNFVNAGFVTEQETLNSGNWITKWWLHSFRSNIKIKAGGLLSVGNPQNGYKPATFEIEANRVRIFDYSPTGGKYIGLESDALFNFGFYANNDIIREIAINSKPIILTQPGSFSSVSGVNTYGYVSLQNTLGQGNIYSNGWPEHRYGSVLIGPTYNSDQQIPLATNSIQALGITRKITRFDGNDAAIKFFQPDIPSNSRLRDARFLTLAGSITPVRTTDYYTNYNGSIIEATLDSVMINAGSFDVTGLTVTLGGTALLNAGRLGLSNNSRTMNKPEFPIHISAIPDAAVRFPYGIAGTDSQLISDYIAHWYAGFDSQDSSSLIPGGIALGNTKWKDNRRIPGYISGISSGIAFWSPSPQPFTNPLLKTYARSTAGLPEFGQTLGEPAPFVPGEAEGDISTWNVVGYENPHMYMQPGKELRTGNVGIGFVPGSTGFSPGDVEYILGSIPLDQISYAKSKLAVNGSITVGPTSSGYHKFNNKLPIGGILVGGLIVQGDTQTQGLDTMRWKGPKTFSNPTGLLNQYNFSSAIDDNLARIQVGFSTPKAIISKQFLSKGSANPMFPDFAISDAKTGMGSMIGELNTGALYADRLVSPGGGTSSVSDTVPPVIVAKWSANGNPGSEFNTGARKRGVGGFTVTEAFALAPAYYNINTIPWYAVNFKINSVDGETSDAHQIIYHKIPCKNSTALIDMSTKMFSYPYFTSTLPIGSFGIVSNKGGRWLDGTGFFNVNPKFNSHQFTVEDGYYDGQILRLMFMDVAPNNYSVLVPNAIPDNGYFVGAGNSNTIYYGPVGIKDNIIMAAEKYAGDINSAGISSSWPLFYPGTQNTEAVNNRPWPMPSNWRTGNDYVIPGASGGAAGQIDAAIKNALNQYTEANTSYWTSSSSGTYYETSVGQNGSFYNLNGSQGIGAFRITPWRSITLQWFFDGGATLEEPTEYGFGDGCWMEIARENLVPRKMKLYSGSGTGGTYPNIVGQPVSGDYIYNDMNIVNPGMPRSLTYYNPSGDCNLLIYSGGTVISQNIGSTSGSFPQYGNLRLSLTTPLCYGTNNEVTVRCKVLNFNAKNGNLVSTVRDITLTSTGSVINLDTFTSGGYLPLPGIGETQSIEVSAIIKRNNT